MPNLISLLFMSSLSALAWIALGLILVRNGIALILVILVLRDEATACCGHHHLLWLYLIELMNWLVDADVSLVHLWDL